MKISVWTITYCVFSSLVFSGVIEASDSGIDKEKKLQNVSDKDAKQMCKAYHADAVEIAKANCTLDALVNAEDKAQCETMQKECLKRVGDEKEDPNECKQMNLATFENCAFTVGELEACVSQLIEYAKSLSCEKFGSELSASPVCMENLQAKCDGTE